MCVTVQTANLKSSKLFADLVAASRRAARALQNWPAFEIGAALVTLKATSGSDREPEHRSVHSMLYTIAVVLFILWLHALVGRRPI
jgi:hypothetical protein